MKNKLTKFGVHNEGFPQTGLQNSKLFNFLSWKHEIFKTTKYKKR